MSAAQPLEAVRVARRHRDALAIALLAKDELNATIAAARLRRALGDLSPTDAEIEMHRSAAPLLAAAPFGLFGASTLARLGRWLDAVDRPDLFEIDLDERSLRETSWVELDVVRANMRAADLSRCAFGDAKFLRCDLSRADLTDATLDGASFEDCDLSDAQLGTTRGCEPIVRATFVRCDLRGTNWIGRSLFGAKLVDCTLLGARDLADLQRSEVVGVERSALAAWLATSSPARSVRGL
jgi:uncharacterized protein YjbI with pentapeptide repeats